MKEKAAADAIKAPLCARLAQGITCSLGISSSLFSEKAYWMASQMSAHAYAQRLNLSRRRFLDWIMASHAVTESPA